MKVTRNRGQTTPCTTVQNSENTTYWLCNGYHNHLTIYGDHHMILWSWTDWICILSFPSIFFAKFCKRSFHILSFISPQSKRNECGGFFLGSLQLLTVIMVCVVTVMLLIWLLLLWCVWWLWCHWFGYGNVSKLLLLLLCYMGLSWSLFWEVWEISAQAHLQMVEAIIAGNIRWNRVRSFSPSWDIVQYVITEPSNQRLKSCW